MFSLTQALVIGAVLLVLAASVPAPRKPKVAWAWVVGFATLGLVSCAVHVVVQASGYAPNSRPSERAKYVREQLPKLKAKNVLWIDGGSYPTKGVRSSVLKSELAKLGYDVDVVNMAIGGANHLEREAMYRTLDDLDAPRGRKKQRWVYMAEVQRKYDEVPMDQFDRNLETARTYHYLTPRVVWDAFWALGSDDIRKHEHPWKQRLELVRHGLVNAFNVGITSRLVAQSEIKAEPGDAPRDTPRGFKYPGLSKVIAAAKSPRPRPVPEWVFDIRERREREIWDEHAERWVYFAIPGTEPTYLEYAIAFCKATKRPCFAPADTKLLTRLDARENWFDKGHMSKRGAQIYTKWLAKKLHTSGALQR